MGLVKIVYSCRDYELIEVNEAHEAASEKEPLWV